MADVEYTVAVEYVTSGSLEKDLSSAFTSASKIGGTLKEAAGVASELGGELVHAFQHAVEHAVHLAGHLAKIGIAAGVAGAAYGVGHLNSQLESTQISLAAVFNAQGLTGGGFNNAFMAAGDQVEKMKNDIKKLPGDLGQMSNVMLQLASPLGRIGKDPDAIRRITGQTMMASQILLGAKYGQQGAQEIGARELSMLLNGNFGSKNTWAMELPGMQQYKSKWKGMSEEERFKIVSERMANLVESTRARFETSWAAVWTTFRDDMKYSLLAPATMPLFNAVKTTLNDLHDALERNDAKVKAFTSKLGEGLAEAWRRGIADAEEWWPKIVSFAQELRSELEVIWTKYGPAIKGVAEDIKTALGDGTALKDIKQILELYAASKAGGMALGAAGGALRVGGSLAQIAAASGGGEVITGGALAAVGATAVMVTAFLGAATLGEFHALADKTSPNHAAAVEAKERLSGATSRFKTEVSDVLDVSVIPALERLGVAATNAAAWMVDPNSIDWGWFTRDVNEPQPVIVDNWDQMPVQYDREREMHFQAGGVSSGKTINEQIKELYATKKGAGGGGGGTHVQKVEIVVNTNQDANRVAEMVVKKIATINRNPKVSGGVPNYSE